MNDDNDPITPDPQPPMPEPTVPIMPVSVPPQAPDTPAPQPLDTTFSTPVQAPPIVPETVTPSPEVITPQAPQSIGTPIQPAVTTPPLTPPLPNTVINQPVQPNSFQTAAAPKSNKLLSIVIGGVVAVSVLISAVFFLLGGGDINYDKLAPVTDSLSWGLTTKDITIDLPTQFIKSETLSEDGVLFFGHSDGEMTSFNDKAESIFMIASQYIPASSYDHAKYESQLKNSDEVKRQMTEAYAGPWGDITVENATVDTEYETSFGDAVSIVLQFISEDREVEMQIVVIWDESSEALFGLSFVALDSAMEPARKVWPQIVDSFTILP